MSMKFDDAIEALCKKIEIPEEEHQLFLDDAEIISSKIYETMVEKNSIFKDMYKELRKTASYQKGDHFDLPNDFSVSLMLELPFEVQLEFCGPYSRTVCFKTNKKHPIVKNGVISKALLIFLVNGNLNNIIPKIKPISCKNGRTYSLKFKSMEWDNLFLHQTIIATEQVEIGSAAKISFKFIPTLKFPIDEKYVPLIRDSDKEAKYWIAIPAHEGEREFLQEIPRDQLVEETHKAKFIYLMRLLKTVYLKFGNESWRESDFNLKALYFKQVYEEGHSYVKNISKSDMIVDWFYAFLMTFALKTNLSLFKKLNEIHSELWYFQLTDAVDMDDLLTMFGLL